MKMRTRILLRSFLCRQTILRGRPTSFIAFLAAMAVGWAPAVVMIGQEIEFNRDVRPILSDKCFHCHGPDSATREADLRLDQEAAAKADRPGGRAIVERNPQHSELVRRIRSSSDNERMPPPDSGRVLSDRERDILEKWIAEGAPWEAHWSFSPPRISAPMESHLATDPWVRNSIDVFILKRLHEHGLKPSPPSSNEALIRRLYLDLTGLPPTLDAVDQFLSDDSPLAYERLVDRLLSSADYGEHMALSWLDAARYADTDGYQNDGPRTMWRWRDWVINAYNDDMPFDQFTIEQLAGDLLPNATLEQRIATGFNRNHRYNSEAGLVLDEFLLENAVDRVDTSMAVWQGLTMGCARCHDHKYDPLSQREYYQLIDMFDNAGESGRAVKFGNSEPVILAPTPTQQDRWTELQKGRDAADQLWQAELNDPTVNNWLVENQPTAAAGDEAPYHQLVLKGLTHQQSFDVMDAVAEPPRKAPTTTTRDTGGVKGNTEGAVGRGLALNGEQAVALGKIGDFSCHQRGTFTFFVRMDDAADGVIFSRQKSNTLRPGFSVEAHDGRLAFYIITRWVAGVGAVETIDKLPTGRWIHIALTNDGSQFASGMKIYVDGVEAKTRTLYNTNSNTGGVAAATTLQAGGGVIGKKFKGVIDEVRYYSRTLWKDEIEALSCVDSIATITKTAREQRTSAQAAKLSYWVSQQTALTRLRRAAISRAARRDQWVQFVDSLPTAMVMDDAKPRPTHVRRRGVYDQRAELVSAGAPAALADGQTLEIRHRLDFANWLVSPDNPLTARVVVNRIWQQRFGAGLVKTAEDFGFQGDLPSHPLLLDHLAVEFQRMDWSVKRLTRLMVTSATYRQSSSITAKQLAQDPDNRWLGRGPRQRLSAQALRDLALSVSGLLVRRQGGPSVSPYQPANLWKEMSNMTYRQSKGADLYRRSLYTIWKRTVAPPSMAILDAADRESCILRPKRTNTPLQALTLLNERLFVEAARNLAGRMLREGGDHPIKYGFRLVTSRYPSSEEMDWLTTAHQSYLKAFQSDLKRAQSLLAIGESPVDKSLPSAEWAALTAVANVLLNLDETVTRD